MTDRNPNLWRPAANLDLPVFENAILTVTELYQANARATGLASIRNRRFANCRIEGPAVLLLHGDVVVSDCNLGEAFGDVRNLIFRPAGELAIGPVPFMTCAFEACSFFSIGFTGSDEVLTQLFGALPEVKS